MRARSQTIGTLGRTPARRSRPVPVVPPPPPSPPPEDPSPGRRGVRRWLHGALLDNVGLKFLSMVLAVTVFLLVNTDKEREITVRVGLKYDYPADKVLVSEQVDDVRITIKGAWRRLRAFDERELGRVRLDLANAPTGEVEIRSDMIANLPPGLSVTSISPRTVHVAFDKVVEKSMEVLPATSGRPQHGYVVAEIKPAPPTVKVRGGERLLGALSSIRTAEVSLEGRTESFAVATDVAPPAGVSVDATARVMVHVRVDEELVTRKMPGLVVLPRGEGVDPARWRVTPSHVEVTLTGALLAVEKARETVTPVAVFGAGREVQVALEGLPPGVGVRISPERVKLAPVR